MNNSEFPIIQDSTRIIQMKQVGYRNQIARQHLWSTCKHFFTSSLIIMQNLVVVSHDTVYVQGPENTGQFIIFWCQISSDCRIPKFIEVG